MGTGSVATLVSDLRTEQSHHKRPHHPPHKPVAARSRILELDGLTGIAILLVLCSHYPGFSGLVYQIPQFGWVGVDVFFGLSGYLITSILLGLRVRPHPYRTFYSRRLIRILPPYLATALFLFFIAFREHWLTWEFVVTQLLFLQGLHPNDRALFLSLLRQPVLILRHLVPFLANAHVLPLAGRGVGMTCATAPMTYWSLSIEEYFYLLWAPIVLRCSRRNILSIAVFVCLLEMLLRWMDATWTAYFSLLCRFDSLLYGALIAILFDYWTKRGAPRWASAFFVYIGAGSLIALSAIVYEASPVLGRELRASVLFTVFGYTFISIAVAALIGLLLLNNGSKRWYFRFLRSRALVFVGTISYTMYLVHIIAGSIVSMVGRYTHLRWSDVSQAIASSLLTVLIAYGSWHWMEKPLLNWKDRYFPNSPHPSEPMLS